MAPTSFLGTHENYNYSKYIRVDWMAISGLMPYPLAPQCLTGLVDLPSPFPHPCIWIGYLPIVRQNQSQTKGLGKKVKILTKMVTYLSWIENARGAPVKSHAKGGPPQWSLPTLKGGAFWHFLVKMESRPLSHTRCVWFFIWISGTLEFDNDNQLS